MRRPAAAVGLLIFSSAILVSCGYQGDYELIVRNTSNQNWLVRVATGRDSAHAGNWVTRVKPGADGLAFRWFGSADEKIELLDEKCSVVGVFEKANDDVYLVSGVDGVQGSVTPAHRSLFEGNVPGIEATTDCGGLTEA